MIVGRDGSCKGNLGLARSIGIGYNLSSENVAGGGICTRKSCGGQQVPNLPRLLISPRQPRSRRAPGWAPDQGSLTTQGRLDPRIITEEVRLLGPQAREGLGFFCRGQVRRRWGMKIYQCDGCGKQEHTKSGQKPPDWFERTDAKTRVEMHVCSRECIEIASAKAGCSPCVLPI